MPSWREKQEFDTSGGMQPGVVYKDWQMEKFADALLIEDTRRELCRKCSQYGEKTGRVEPSPQFDKDGEPVLDESGDQLVIDYPELKCPKGHRWFLGEGERRGIGGKDPILFESHLADRKRREIYCAAGQPDPGIVSGLYNRCVDSDTYAVTPRGLRSYDELKIGDLVTIYDPDLNEFKAEKLQGLYIYHHLGNLYQINGWGLDALVTNNHRWLVSDTKNGELGDVYTDRLEPGQYVPRHDLAGSKLTTRQPLVYSLKGDLNERTRIDSINPIMYDGIAWCPTVETGFWVAHRNGTEYVTGNSHPQGRKVNSPEQRKKNGSSFYGS